MADVFSDIFGSDTSVYWIYTVQPGDTLSQIAKAYASTTSQLAALNGISNPDRIQAGQGLKIPGYEPGKLPTQTPSKPETKKVSNIIDTINIGLMVGSEREVYITWEWDRDDTDHYEVKWMYATGSGVGFIGSTESTQHKQHIYSAPDRATHVAVYVKPVAKSESGSESDSVPWTAEWSTRVAYYFKDNPPVTPTGLNVSIVQPKWINIVMDNLDTEAMHTTELDFQIWRWESEIDRKWYRQFNASVKLYSPSETKGYINELFVIEPGYEYQVRYRAVRGDSKTGYELGEWSEFSEIVSPAPPAPKEILELRALSTTSVYLDWSKVASATQYEIEYAKKKSRFDSSNETQSITVGGDSPGMKPLSHAEIELDETGIEWFFRVRAVNEHGSSLWTPIKSVVIGTKPSPPTTWSSVTVAEVGEEITLYWVHNSEDESKEKQAIVTIYIDGEPTMYIVPKDEEDNEKNLVSSYVLKTNNLTGDHTIMWHVATMGALPKFGDDSVTRTINIYTQPSASVFLGDGTSSLSTLESFPLKIQMSAGPDTQMPMGYHLSVIALESYEGWDVRGNTVYVSEGDEIYYKYIDKSVYSATVILSATDIELQNNIAYSVRCTVAMDSGLTATANSDFVVAWNRTLSLFPNAELIYNKNTYSMSIKPYCTYDDGTFPSDIELSVYRREADGRFVEIATELKNNNKTYVTDPHPSLDYARYRIVATHTKSGTITYFDTAAYPIKEPAIIIQWDEEWSHFDLTDDDIPEYHEWTGSLVRLPFNVDISESNEPDVTLVNYIGREHPVSYYGTQIGQKISLSAVIASTDIDTLYAIRRLSRWMGDVYIREPSGNGYHANITVSFNKNHCEVTIPVSIEVTRVEGGA